MGTETAELVKMSSKGQLVVPQNVRNISNLSPGERFLAFPVEEGVLFRNVELPKVNLDFKSLSNEIESQFKKNKVRKNDVVEAVKWARKR